MKIVRQQEQAQSAKPVATLTLLNAHLTSVQLDSLKRCAKGISIRFENEAIVDALLVGGYAQKSLAGVISVTAKGLEYLKAHAR